MFDSLIDIDPVAYRTQNAIMMGRKTFSQLRADAALKIPSSERYSNIDLGHRKHGMIGVESIKRAKPKHGRKAKQGQPLGGRGDRFYKAR